MGTRRLPRKFCVATTAGLLLLPACVRAYDATIDNPCDTELSLKTYRTPPEESDEDERVAQFRVPPEEVTVVRAAFDEAAGTRWTLMVVDTDFEIEVSKQQVEDETILIPASACP